MVGHKVRHGLRQQAAGSHHQRPLHQLPLSAGIVDGSLPLFLHTTLTILHVLCLYNGRAISVDMYVTQELRICVIQRHVYGYYYGGEKYSSWVMCIYNISNMYRPPQNTY